MVRVRQYLPATLLFVMACLLFSGCATAPKVLESSKGESVSEEAATVAPAPAAVVIRSAQLQSAMDALDVDNYQQAVKHFDEILQNGQEVPAAYLYEYGLGLSQLKRYQEATEVLSNYLDNYGSRDNHYYEAIGTLESANQNLQLQRKEETRSATIKKHQSGMAQDINTNWSEVQQQVAAETVSITEPLTGMEMILVKGGCYEMGDQFGDGNEDELPVHEVCVDDFFLGKYEVTQQQWSQVMGYNPSKFQQGGQYPVDMVSWQDATAFAKALSGAKGNYRLPTEAEWEYAARSGGKLQKYSGSNNIEEVAWHEDNADRRSHLVGQKNPNQLGFYDMSGNLYEWCLDRYAADYYLSSPKQNPTGAATGSDRSRRGGSWDSEPSYSRTSYRAERDEVEHRHKKTGFRLALPALR